MRNRVTELTGAEYPILLGPMRFISLGAVAASVSGSGGFGQIAGSGLNADRLRREIRLARELTGAPFGVNIPVYRDNAFEALEVAIEEGVRMITTSAGDPNKLIKRIREAGLKVFHKCSTVSMARKAQDAGVDGVIASGAEAGGHVSREQITTFALIPQLVDVLEIPVVAAGGIGDGRGLLAAFALGAEGVEMGTRFLATTEAPVPEGYKRRIVSADCDGTTIIREKAMPARILRNQAATAIEQMERRKTPGEQINAYTDTFYCHEDPDKAIMPAGQVAGLVRSIANISEVIGATIREAGLRLTVINNFFAEET
ncbi:MAG: Nitronate monooxygenase [Syntrophorhabdus sp. PtaU1.Bin058]|nr:MAG: Nitronate monooxygenase [Syntrophorhabdus sp. PtaU1.Bin058]